MYCDFYRLRERPFNVTADPKFLYLNARYREALASLHYGISQRKGFITLIGEAGTGKTTLLKKLLDDLDATTRTVFIFNTNVSFDEILEYIFGEFDLPIHNGKRLYMLQRLNAFLLEELRNGRNVALLIDEAQDLDFSVLEDLRLLSNLETAKEKILQIVLSGQTELGQKLGNPGLRQLRQRVAVNCRLLPLTRDEVSEYIQSRLTAAGSADPKIFTRDAEDRIFEISTGIPRLVNIVCDNALVIGYALGKKRIGADVVNEAAADLLSIQPAPAVSPAPALPEPPAAESAATVVQTVPRGRSVSQLGVVAAVAVAIVVGLFSVGRSLLRRDLVGVEPSAANQSWEVVAPGSRTGEAPAFKPPAEPPKREPAYEPPAAEPEAVARQPEEERVAARAADGAADEFVDPARNAPPPVPADEFVDLGRNARPPAPARQAEPVVAAEPSERRPERVEVAPVPPAPREEEPEELADVEEPAVVEKRRVEEVQPAAAKPQVQAAVEREAVAAEDVPPARPAAEPVLVPAAEEKPAQPAQREEAAENTDAMKLAMRTYQTVRVQPGQTVSEIAVRNYGQASPTILDMMKIANPSIRNIDVISVGQSLELPQLDEGFVILKQGGGGYALLLMSTPIQQRANEIEGALRERGFQARVRKADFGSGQSVSRVMIGGLTTRDDAVDVGKRLQKLFREDERIAAMAR